MSLLDELSARGRDAITGRLTDPFAFLGPHDIEDGLIVRAFLPGAVSVELRVPEGGKLAGLVDIGGGLFEGRLQRKAKYVLRIEWPDAVQETEDPYSYGPLLAEEDLSLFRKGALFNLAEKFGAHVRAVDGVDGVFFAVWAPSARRVSVVGDFNSWDGRRHPMRLRHDAGVWELFVPRLKAGERYKYEIIGNDGALLPQKADPLARAAEAAPATASVVAPTYRFEWSDETWMKDRGSRQSPNAPVSIYEVHLGSWLRQNGDISPPVRWQDLAERLVPYAAEMGFSHIELLPIMAHPFGGSWGYQPLSLFAPMAHFGDPSAFAGFVDACHRAGLGVILDWVPGHFPNDAHGLVRFDGTALYEHANPLEGFHKDWNTLIYNYGRTEVREFLIASALYWLDVFHLDGLRVDAVASMLYRDYSRAHGEWVPNRYGGRENLEAVDLLREMNNLVAQRHAGAITVAEESTAWPGVSAPTAEGGLGFTYKWNMGWMHDTLRYMSQDPVYRSWHHHEVTFGLVYAFSERFILPLSHDEVVHGKGSLIDKMPGDSWQKFASLRAYYAFMWAHPGKKLLFMGGEIAQQREWSHDRQLDWGQLESAEHGGIQCLVQDLNAVYRAELALHALDADRAGFEWIIGDDAANSVFSFMRHAPDARSVLCVFNMTPVTRHNYRIGVPHNGTWREILNSNADIYGGNNAGNVQVAADNHSAHGKPFSLNLTLPPMCGLFLVLSQT